MEMPAQHRCIDHGVFSNEHFILFSYLSINCSGRIIKLDSKELVDNKNTK